MNRSMLTATAAAVVLSGFLGALLCAGDDEGSIVSATSLPAINLASDTPQTQTRGIQLEAPARASATHPVAVSTASTRGTTAPGMSRHDPAPTYQTNSAYPSNSPYDSSSYEGEPDQFVLGQDEEPEWDEEPEYDPEHEE